MPLTAKEQEELRQLESELGTPKEKPFAAAPNSPEAQVLREEMTPVVQEMHPDISVGERALVKNLANSPQSAVAYLQKQHPDMEFKITEGQIQMKKPAEKEFRVLDPSPEFDNPAQALKDVPQDISDVAYDIPAGMASGMAAAAAGAAAGPAAIPSAAITGGITSASLEATRQKLGKMAGIPQEVSGKDVAISGALGAAAPLVAGTGATRQMIAKELGPTASKEAVDTAVQAQKGLFQKGAERFTQKTLPSLGESVSGVPAERIKSLGKNWKAVSQMDDAAATELAATTHEEIKSGLAQMKQSIGKELESTIDNTPIEVDLSKAKSILDNHIASLEKGHLKDNPQIRETIANLKSARDNIFKEYQLQPKINPATGQAMLDESGKPIMEEVLVELPGKVKASKAFQLQDLIRQEADLPLLQKQQLGSRFGGKMTAAEKQWGNANQQAYQAINKELDSATGAVSSDLKKKYREFSELQRDLNARFKDPETTYKTLTTLDTKSNTFTRQRLDQLKESLNKYMKEKGMEGEVNPAALAIESGDLLSTYGYFGKPSSVPLSGGGSTSTSRTGLLTLAGAGAGYKLGGKQGALIGATAANLAGSPRGIKTYVGLGQGVQRGAQKLYSQVPSSPVLMGTPLVTPPGVVSSWANVKKQEER